MKAGVDELERRVRDKKLAAIGFCFGGGMVWRLLASGERRLAAAVPVLRARSPRAAISRGSTAAVLGIYAGLDTRVNASRDAARGGARGRRPRVRVRHVPEADHAFFNDTGPARFNPAAMAEAYRRVLDWFGRFVAERGDREEER